MTTDDLTPDYAALDETFQKRFDIARMVLERKHRWAKHTLRNLQPVRSFEHPTMAVDGYLRLYHGDQADHWTDKEFVGALWHEVNHILRHHHDRLSELPGRLNTAVETVLISSDLEINDDLADQGIGLPEGTGLVSEDFGHQHGLAAEQHIYQFIEEQMQQASKGPSEQSPDGGKDNPDGEGDQDSGDGEGEGDPTDADSGGNEGDADDGSEDGDDGSGAGSNGDDESSSSGESQSGGGQGEPTGPPQLPDDYNGCGSGSGGEAIPDELGEPEAKDQGKLERAARKQAEDIQEAAENSTSGLPPGMSQEMVDAAIEFLGKPEHDWRRTMATEIRNAMEQRADEAEEYSFRRQSRRAGAVGDDYILPGSFRPVPKLFVYADVSGSMDQNKLTASVREVHGILERLAIPSFIACGWNTVETSRVEVAGRNDVDKVFAKRGGGTDMQAAVDDGVQSGAEVIVVLTDNDTHWNTNAPDGVPIIIGGINRSERREVPKWARLVDVGEVPVVEYDEEEVDWSW